MGLFSGIFGLSKKLELVRNLTRQRVKLDPLAASSGFTPAMVDELTDAQLMGLPEATIATIVETYADQTRRGATPALALQRIEAFRAPKMGGGRLPDPLNLETYCAYRLAIEHSHGAPISVEIIDIDVTLCRIEFACLKAPGEVVKVTRSLTPHLPETKPPRATYKDRYRDLLMVCRGYIEGEFDDEEFQSSIQFLTREEWPADHSR